MTDMGTDIHAFVEYANTPSGECFRGDAAYPALLFAEFHLSRNYELFDALANGRNREIEGHGSGKRALFPPRGIPVDLSHRLAMDYFDLIETSAIGSGVWPRLGRVSEYEARGRVESGVAHYGSVLQSSGKDRLLRTVSKPFWHTPSWLLSAEIDAALQHFGLGVGALGFDFRLLMEIVKALEAEFELGRVRLVFWFDN